MATVVKSFAIQGIDGYPVDIEIKTLEGQPMISTSGWGIFLSRRRRKGSRPQLMRVDMCFPKRK